MNTKAFKIALTFVVLSAALGGLMYTTLAEGTEYYLHVDEVMQDPAAWKGKRLQVHGFVADLRQRPNTLDYKFNVQYNGKVITGDLHRDRARHVQERIGSRGQGQAVRRRLRRRAQRRDGQVPVQIQSANPRRGR